MTYHIEKTELEGFPVQYSRDVIQHLNDVVRKSSDCSGGDIKRIGTLISSSTKYSLYAKTQDNYDWFGKLEFKVDNANVAVLFPWHRNHTHSVNQMDRPINVYSDKTLPTQTVENLLEKLAYQFRLATLTKIIEPDQLPHNEPERF